jgi:primosomal protein N'
MNIKRIISQNRRDFSALYECEHCEATVTGAGYDDDHFHQKVIPKMACGSCGQLARSKYSPLATKYAAECEV